MVRQRNAGAAVDQFANASEIRRGEFEITSRVSGFRRFGLVGTKLCARYHYQSSCLRYEASLAASGQFPAGRVMCIAGSRLPANVS
jgi:hypothetical protein